jgi:hypothetical protein
VPSCSTISRVSGACRDRVACSPDKLGCLGAHLIDIATEKIGDVFGRPARSQAVSQVLEIERRPGRAGVDIWGVGRRLFTQIRHVK